MNQRSETTQLSRPIPLYEQVKRRIAEAILSGDMPAGQSLPNEVALAAQYGVAVGTIRRALADLTQDGMLARRRKLGTVVTNRAPQHSLRFFFQYFRLHGEDGSFLTTEAEVLSLNRRPATEAEAKIFGEPAGELLIDIHRIRRIKGEPVMHSRIQLVARRLPDFPEEPSAVPARLYLHLLDVYGVRISAVRERLRAVLASKEDRALLDSPDPSAVLAIDEEAFDQSGAVALISSHHAKTDGRVYVNEVR